MSGVEGRTVFKVTDDLFDCIDRGSSALEQLPAQSKGGFAPGPVRFDQRVGNIPGATVDNERNHATLPVLSVEILMENTKMQGDKQCRGLLQGVPGRIRRGEARLAHRDCK